MTYALLERFYMGRKTLILKLYLVYKCPCDCALIGWAQYIMDRRKAFLLLSLFKKYFIVCFQQFYKNTHMSAKQTKRTDTFDIFMARPHL
ncbi:hypothetical protein A9Q92_07390 [Methylophaga sp. 42_8_T64]|nr:hypothetical protein A9Q92_07390 [Methylophaga sp. 42_8_T64]